MRRRAIDPGDLQRLYVDQRMPTVRVAHVLGCGASTIRRRLRELGISLRPRGPAPRLAAGPLPWSAGLAYAVGLITSDGCLSGDGRHVHVTSKDLDLLETLRSCLSLAVSIGRSRSGKGTRYFRLQWGDRRFYTWLLGIGLMPAKSRRLGRLDIPDEWFRDFLRGCIDGDGSIVVYTDRWHAARKATYVYERLYVSLFSASPPFLEWVNETLARLIGVRTAVWTRRDRACSMLRYAGKQSRTLLAWLYYSSDVPSLRRKRLKALSFLPR